MTPFEQWKDHFKKHPYALEMVFPRSIDDVVDGYLLSPTYKFQAVEYVATLHLWESHRHNSFQEFFDEIVLRDLRKLSENNLIYVYRVGHISNSIAKNQQPKIGIVVSFVQVPKEKASND